MSAAWKYVFEFADVTGAILFFGAPIVDLGDGARIKRESREVTVWVDRMTEEQRGALVFAAESLGGKQTETISFDDNAEVA